MQTLKKLTVTAQENEKTYTFEALELPSGQCVVSYDNTNDAWFNSRGEIEANGNAFVIGIEDTGETVEWTGDEIRQSVAGSAREFGKDSVPSSVSDYLKSIGSKGGKARTAKKAAAVRANGKKGGRPAKYIFVCRECGRRAKATSAAAAKRGEVAYCPDHPHAVIDGLTGK